MLLADPADNIPVGAPYFGANAPIKSGRILKGRSRGRHFRERTPTSRVRSEMSQTSALPSTLTRTVARAGNRDSTPGSEVEVDVDRLAQTHVSTVHPERDSGVRSQCPPTLLGSIEAPKLRWVDSGAALRNRPLRTSSGPTLGEAGPAV